MFNQVCFLDSERSQEPIDFIMMCAFFFFYLQTTLVLEIGLRFSRVVPFIKVPSNTNQYFYRFNFNNA